MTITIQDLADYCSATVQGGDTTVMLNAAADIINAQPGQVTQLTNSRYSKYLQTSLASACFIADDFVVPDGIPASVALLVCADPEMAFIKAVGLLHPERLYPTTIAAQAVVPGSTELGDNIHVGAYAVLGEHCKIGTGTQVLAGVYIGNHVKIGQHCKLHPYCVIYDHTVIGDNVIVHSGAIIGADGFGYKFRNHQHVKVPQVGNVVIENNVEIGANTCIDRGALGSTMIGLGSKIDNLVQIGHNNQIGKHVIMCGGVGVSGSCHINDYAILAGSAGIADHVTIGQGAVVMARAGVANDIAAGSHVFGSPAKDKRIAYKEQVALSKLPDLLKKVKLLEEKIAQLEQQG